MTALVASHSCLGMGFGSLILRPSHFAYCQKLEVSKSEDKALLRRKEMESFRQVVNCLLE